MDIKNKLTILLELAKWSVWPGLNDLSPAVLNQALIAIGELRPTTKPDLDNLVKGIKDGCTKIIWHDDAQIVEMVARKFYGMQPRAEVKIEVLCNSNKPE